MLHTTRWRPDTCGCELEYEWDDELPAEKRTHAIHAVHVACEAHRGLAAEDHYAAVVKENTSKNIAHAMVLRHFPHLTEIVETAVGQHDTRLKKGVTFGWEFDDKRSLHVSVSGMTAADKAALHSLVGSEPGLGAVVIV